MHYFQEVFRILKKASIFGEEVSQSGVTLLGRVRHVGPEAWMHTIYPPLEDSDVNLLEEEIKIAFPDDLREFLELTNGLNVFSDNLAIFGRRTSFDRNSDEREPYSIVSINLYERPADLPEGALIIGSYSFQDGFLLYMERNTSRVIRSRRSSAKPLMSWDSVGTMLLSEVERFDKLFDQYGMLRNPRALLVPIT